MITALFLHEAIWIFFWFLTEFIICKSNHFWKSTSDAFILGTMATIIVAAKVQISSLVRILHSKEVVFVFLRTTIWLYLVITILLNIFGFYIFLFCLGCLRDIRLWLWYFYFSESVRSKLFRLGLLWWSGNLISLFSSLCDLLLRLFPCFHNRFKALILDILH